jgi:chemotaxis protein CheD
MIGIGEYRVGSFPMMTIGLGSCIGLTIYDDTLKVGAMVHIMLPESAGRTDRPGKYADTAVPVLLKELSALGSRNRSLVAKMAGGACMFEYFGANLNIGERNADKVRALLKEHNIPLVKEDVGGKMGRSVTFLPAGGGKVSVRRADGTISEL